ncbi:MAG: efflux RND transporter periplasmic adaptor subunit [Bacteroidales bacterium]|nr:efflux RND transporter periplasmic adaptor subunit [Bacteroidales bacterium]
MKTYYNISFFAILTLLLAACNGRTEPATETASAEQLSIRNDQFIHEQMQLGQIQTIAFEQTLVCSGSLVPKPNGKAILNAPLPGIIKSIACQNGQVVQKNQILFEVGGASVIDLQKDFAEAAAGYGRLKSEFERAQTLYDQQVNSEKDYRNTQSDYQTARAHYQGLKLKMEAMGLSPQRIENGEFYASYPIKAPIGGSISGLQANIGTYIDSQSELAAIIDPAQLQLQLNVFPKDLALLEEGQAVRYQFANSETAHHASLLSVGSAINEASKAVDCYASLTAPLPKSAIASQFVTATIIACTDSAQALPSEAIVQTESGPMVLLLQKQDNDAYQFIKTPVKTGREYKTFTEILDGPKEGSFLTGGLYNLTF